MLFAITQQPLNKITNHPIVFDPPLSQEIFIMVIGLQAYILGIWFILATYILGIWSIGFYLNETNKSNYLNLLTS